MIIQTNAERGLRFSFALCIKFSALSLFRMDFFWAAHGRRGGGGGQKDPLPKICHTYPTIMKLGTVIPYLKKIQKLYESRDTLLEFC